MCFSTPSIVKNKNCLTIVFEMLTHLRIKTSYNSVCHFVCTYICNHATISPLKAFTMKCNEVTFSFQKIIPRAADQLIFTKQLITIVPVHQMQLPAPPPASLQASLSAVQSSIYALVSLPYLTFPHLFRFVCISGGWCCLRIYFFLLPFLAYFSLSQGQL